MPLVNKVIIRLIIEEKRIGKDIKVILQNKRTRFLRKKIKPYTSI